MHLLLKKVNIEILTNIFRCLHRKLVGKCANVVVYKRSPVIIKKIKRRRIIMSSKMF